jgi:hypothetical protein
MGACCVITTHPFWSEPLGSGALMRSRYKLLQSLFENVYVVFISETHQRCPLPGLTIHNVGVLSPFQISTIGKFIEKNNVTYSHFSYISLSNVAKKLKCRTGVEIHDVLHVREQQFKAFGYSPTISISLEEEVEHLKCFTYIFSISVEETNYLQGIDLHCHYLPPTIEFQSTPCHSKTTQLGIIGSRAIPNIDGLEQFANHSKFSSSLFISGALAMSGIAKNMNTSRRTLNGIVADVREHYELCQISIAPIRFGAGLKIKVLESLSFGRPCISTSHAASGFPGGIDQVTVIQDDFSCWDDNAVVTAQQISQKKMKEYCLDNFSTEIAGKALQAVIT